MFEAFRRRLQRTLPEPVLDASDNLLRDVRCGSEAALHPLSHVAPKSDPADPAEADAANPAKRAKLAEPYQDVLQTFEEAVATWRRLAESGLAPPDWFDDCIRALGRELA